ncbi:DUF305 domain-containing protein [Reticulibacter mediterranei]|uniref:DUF305 domain-containing protein n=1 Tax=Reticulibacter mediterranei TaxID=2778369 RepID=UPI003570DB53
MNSLSGKTFETTFMSMMIHHHSMAIDMSKDCVNHASHDKLLHLCKSIIASQSKEIREMNGWLCDWYDRCEKNK